MDIRAQDVDGISWDVARDEEDLDRLAPEWDALNARCGPEGFFTRMDLLRANWARHKDDPRTTLNVVAIRDRGRLVLGAPMIRRRERVGTHMLRWLDSKTPFYDDLLLDPALDPVVAARLLKRYLFSSWTRRLLKIGFVPEGRTLHRVLVAASLPLTFRTVAPSLDISIFATWSEYLAAMPAKRRQQYGNFSRRLQKAGAEAVHLVTEPEEVRAEITRLFARKRQWVQERQLADWILPAETEAWFQRVVAIEDEGNRFHLLRIRSGTEWIASVMCFERDGTLFLSKMAHNPDWERFSPGWVLIVGILQLAIERKLSKVDFMIGRSEWKNRLSDHLGAVYSCRANLLPWHRTPGPAS